MTGTRYLRSRSTISRRRSKRTYYITPVVLFSIISFAVYCSREIQVHLNRLLFFRIRYSVYSILVLFL
jgi:hypothetical protein